MGKASLLQSWQLLQRWVLPLRCLLCGARGADGIDLCADCAAELPRNHSCCAMLAWHAWTYGHWRARRRHAGDGTL